ncbi:mitochondrial coenzyme A transporter SLC25A42 isoform X2 [Lemur catta]|uniref:mitochondrial coenzyme A transporter SLC25A42 isoform X2 n=1 Tax=Lemur catta TaxID=9447 RepID=UPI001E26CAA8|nr:mitochondrial coenzyme A transporter SLC25A42 isoform X2 [Lemur catta]
MTVFLDPTTAQILGGHGHQRVWESSTGCALGGCSHSQFPDQTLVGVSHILGVPSFASHRLYCAFVFSSVFKKIFCQGLEDWGGLDNVAGWTNRGGLPGALLHLPQRGLPQPVARELRHYGASGALRCHPVQRARGVQASPGPLLRLPRRSPAPVASPSRRRTSWDDRRFTDLPPGPGQGEDGCDPKGNVQQHISRLHPHLAGRGPEDPLPRIYAYSAGGHSLRRPELLHLRDAEEPAQRVQRPPATLPLRAHDLRRLRRPHRAVGLLPAGRGAAAHADGRRHRPPARLHRVHAAHHCAGGGRGARPLQGPEHELGQGPHSRGHQLHHLRPHADPAAAPAELGALLSAALGMVDRRPLWFSEPVEYGMLGPTTGTTSGTFWNKQSGLGAGAGSP